MINLCQNNPSGYATVSQISTIVNKTKHQKTFPHYFSLIKKTENKNKKPKSFLCSPCSFFHFKFLYMSLSLLSFILSPIHSFMFFKESNYPLYLTIYHFVLLQCLLKAQFFQEVSLEEQKMSLKMAW